jgi:hypothetical protein
VASDRGQRGAAGRSRGRSLLRLPQLKPHFLPCRPVYHDRRDALTTAMRDMPIRLQRTELAHLLQVGDAGGAGYEPR